MIEEKELERILDTPGLVTEEGSRQLLLSAPKWSCSHCIFFDPVEGVFGHCQRYPPIALSFGDDLCFGLPEVRGDTDRCGEWTQAYPPDKE